MMNMVKRTIVGVFTVLLAVGCSAITSQDTMEEPETLPEPVTLTISGSGGTTLILSAIQAEFEADTPGYHLEVLTGTGTGGGVEGVSEKVLDVAAMARPPKDEELETAPSLKYVEIGRAAQALYTYVELDVDTLTSDQAKELFLGGIGNWSEVGGADVDVFLYVRDEGDSSTQALREALFGDTPFGEDAEVMTSQADMIAAVEGTPGAVGFGTWPAVLAAGANVDPIALDGVPPGDSTYPITTTMGIGYLEENVADVQPLIDWLSSERGQAVLQEFDVIVK
jgi:phosphate transport system substrate-binding protein